MVRRQLLTDDERQTLLGIPPDDDSLARLFTLSRADRNLVAERRGDANRLGCAVQLALLRYPGTALAYLDQPLDALVSWMARLLEIPADAFAEYALHRSNTCRAICCTRARRASMGVASSACRSSSVIGRGRCSRTRGPKA